MKKLGKLSINPEKVMKNEELVNLRGGYETACCFCNDDRNYAGGQYIVGSTESDCQADCLAIGFNNYTWLC